MAFDMLVLREEAALCALKGGNIQRTLKAQGQLVAAIAITQHSS